MAARQQASKHAQSAHRQFVNKNLDNKISIFTKEENIFYVGIILKSGSKYGTKIIAWKCRNEKYHT